MTRIWARLGAMLAIAITAVLVVPGIAFAHASQTGSSPAADEVVTTAPTQVRIDFDSALLDVGAALVVRSEAGDSITTGPAVVGDRDFTVPVDPAAPNGVYSVAYRVVSKDGHTIENSFTYVVAGEASPAADESATPEATPEVVAEEPVTPEATPEPIAEQPVVADEPSPAPDTTGAPPEGSVMPFVLFGGIGLVIVIGIVGAVLLRK